MTLQPTANNTHRNDIKGVPPAAVPTLLSQSFMASTPQQKPELRPGRFSGSTIADLFNKGATIRWGINE